MHNKCNIMKNIINALILVIIIISSSSIIFAKDKNELTIEEFIKTAVENDTVFEEILIDELVLKYNKKINLSAGDLILAVKSEHEFNIDQEEYDPVASISLSKLFPYKGTGVSAEYKTTSLSGSDSSEFILQITQPIAENAFGKSIIIQDKIIDKENKIAKYQIVESYEDYMALIITAYYNWYSAYEKLKIAESSYKQSLILLKNIRDRQSSKIALPIDVNKVSIQVLTKKESLIELKENYEKIHNFIKQAIRYKGKDTIEPVDPLFYDNRHIEFEKDYKYFADTSRTYQILSFMEDKYELQLKEYADKLLPSTDLLLGYNIQGDGISLKNADSLVSAGISVSWPFPSQKEKAQYETAKISKQKNEISNTNKYIKLQTNLENLFLQIEREKKIISIVKEKIALSESILKDETENYSYGKVTLNDYIDAVNRVDENRFSMILHSVQLKILMTEWFRITDQLINNKKK